MRSNSCTTITHRFKFKKLRKKDFKSKKYVTIDCRKEIFNSIAAKHFKILKNNQNAIKLNVCI